MHDASLTCSRAVVFCMTYVVMHDAHTCSDVRIMLPPHAAAGIAAACRRLRMSVASAAILAKGSYLLRSGIK